MKKYIIPIILLVSLSLIVFADSDKPVIKSLHAVGKGIAISSTDPSDFKLLKIGIARVNVHILGQEQDVTVGLIILDDQTHRLRNINISNSSVTADVFGNDTNVGSLSIASVQKGDTTVWFGTLSVNGKSYNVYILEALRQVKTEELRENVADFCKANKNNTNCRENMADFCEKNPTDARCKQIFLEFCKNSPGDVRCREAVTKYCQERPNDAICKKILGEKNDKFCEHAGDMTEKQCERVADACEKACHDDNQCERVCKTAEDACKGASSEREDDCRGTTTTMPATTTTISTTTTLANITTTTLAATTTTTLANITTTTSSTTLATTTTVVPTTTLATTTSTTVPSNTTTTTVH